MENETAEATETKKVRPSRLQKSFRRSMQLRQRCLYIAAVLAVVAAIAAPIVVGKIASQAAIAELDLTPQATTGTAHAILPD